MTEESLQLLQNIDKSVAVIGADMKSMHVRMDKFEVRQDKLEEDKADKLMVNEIKSALERSTKETKEYFALEHNTLRESVMKNTTWRYKYISDKKYVLGGLAVIGILWPIVLMLANKYWF